MGENKVHCYWITPYVSLGLKKKPSVWNRFFSSLLLGWRYELREGVRQEFYGLYIDTTREEEINFLEESEVEEE